MGWEGEERREHDRDCDDKLEKCVAKVKEWVKDQICLATKGTKAKQVMMWTVMTLMLGASFSSAYTSISAAQDATAIHVRNTTDIAHLKDEVLEVKDDHEALVDTVEEMRRIQGRIDRNISKIAGKMGIDAE